MYLVTEVYRNIDENGEWHLREVATHEFPAFLSAITTAVLIHGDDAVFNAIENYEGNYYMVSDNVGYAIHKVEDSETYEYADDTAWLDDEDEDEVKEEDVDVADAAA